jgi:cyclohexyl-isocyanide hydratase
LVGQEEAKLIQLAMEYDPAPPFTSGNPTVAEPATVARLRERIGKRQEQRAAVVREAAKRLAGTSTVRLFDLQAPHS